MNTSRNWPASAPLIRNTKAVVLQPALVVGSGNDAAADTSVRLLPSLARVSWSVGFGTLAKRGPLKLSFVAALSHSLSGRMASRPLSSLGRSKLGIAIDDP